MHFVAVSISYVLVTMLYLVLFWACHRRSFATGALSIQCEDPALIGKWQYFIETRVVCQTASTEGRTSWAEGAWNVAAVSVRLVGSLGPGGSQVYWIRQCLRPNRFLDAAVMIGNQMGGFEPR